MALSPKYISEHLSYDEAVNSLTAKRAGIENIPDEQQLGNIKIWADKIFEPLRAGVNTPIHCDSVFRSPELNAIIPGASATSQHVAGNGAAGDLDNTGQEGWARNCILFYYIRDYLLFDQLIWEFGDDGNPDWVHVSYNEGKNRKQIQRSYRHNGITEYKNL